MDNLLLNHYLHTLKTRLKSLKSSTDDYMESNDLAVEKVEKRVTGLEEADEAVIEVLDTLKKRFDDIDKKLHTTQQELDKTKIINLKQEIVIRTLNNLTAFSGYDMFTDTFANGDYINWDVSTRAEMIDGSQAVGRTNKSIIEVQQTSQTSMMLLGNNASSDHTISQSFLVQKDKRIDRIDLYLQRNSIDTYKPIVIKLKAGLYDTDSLSEYSFEPGELSDGWIEILQPNITLEKDKEYYIEISTEDVYGYKVGMDPNDKYLAGTSYSTYEGVATDNNFDISFKVWCYPALDENNATIVSKPHQLSSIPASIIFEAEQTVVDGSVNYSVSRDGGINWKTLMTGSATDLSSLPEGNEIVIRAYVEGKTRIEAWGYVVTRSDT